MSNVTALREASTDTGLEIVPGLRLPAEAVTETFALLAKRGAGKSNTAAVLAEELHHAGLPWVAVDPKGDYWGLRSSADGTSPGLPVPIFGGLRGDLPLEPEAGALIADLIVESNLTCVLDVSEFASKAAQTRFLTDFAERLYRQHGKHPQPRHLILEEADDYLPQRVMRDQARCVGAWTRIVTKGRQRGLGITLVSQRSAVVNKDALTQTETLIALRTTAPQDRKAILDWVDYHAVARELVDSLPSLADGEAWVSSPHWLGIMQRIRFRRRATFDSGATPTLGRGRRPATIADIDLGWVRDRMAAVVERAQADDPKVLRRRIAELERELAGIRATQPEPRVERIEVEVPVLSEDLVGRLEAAVAPLFEVADGIQHAGDAIGEALGRWHPPAGSPPPAPPLANRPAPPRSAGPCPTCGGPHDSPCLALPPEYRSAGPVRLAADGPGRPPKAQRAILTVLAQHPQGRTKRQLALQTGYAVKGGGFGNALGALRSAGLIERGEPIRATQAGLDALGDAFQPLPTGGPALLEHWAGQLGKAEGLILRALVAAWPGTLTKQEVADRTGYAADGGGFGNALGRLRTLELIHGYRDLRADDALCSS
jgi:uncharacterized protein